MICKYSADQLLSTLMVPDLPNSYQLGCHSERVTIQCQQSRAFNLIWALSTKHGNAIDVGIVGGGFAGCTAAAAAALLGWKVTIYERADQLFHLQRGNRLRFVHPYVIEWPAAWAFINYTNFPILNWEAGIPEDVVRQAESQFEQFRPLMTIWTNTQVEVIAEPGETPLLETKGAVNSQFSHQFVIFAVGHGLEQPVKQVPWLSYWQNDRLSQPTLAPKKRRRYLITGIGDSALTDALRLCIKDFDHGEYVQKLLYELALNGPFNQLLHYDEEARKCADESLRSMQLMGNYQSLRFADFLLKTTKKHVRVDTEVVLNGRVPTPLSLKASIFNRIALMCLIKADVISYIQGDSEVESIEDNLYTVRFKQESDDYRATFDEVIARRGPISAISQLLGENVSKKVKELSPPAERDFTRHRQYDPAFWQKYLQDIVPQNTPTVSTLLRGLLATFRFHRRIDEAGLDNAISNSKADAEACLEEISKSINAKKASREMEPVLGNIMIPNYYGTLDTESEYIVFRISWDQEGSIADDNGTRYNTRSGSLLLFSTCSRILLDVLNLKISPYIELRYFVDATTVRDLPSSKGLDENLGIHCGISGIMNEPFIYVLAGRGMYSAHSILPPERCIELLQGEVPQEELPDIVRCVLDSH